MSTSLDLPSTDFYFLQFLIPFLFVEGRSSKKGGGCSFGHFFVLKIKKNLNVMKFNSLPINANHNVLFRIRIERSMSRDLCEQYHPMIPIEFTCLRPISVVTKQNLLPFGHSFSNVPRNNSK